MKKLLSFVLCACLLLTLFLPAVLAEEPVKIIFWHSMGGVNGEAINKMVADFNAANAGKIEVEVQFQGDYDEAINKLKSASMGNMGADVVQIYDIGTRFMIDSGWIIPMQELIDADNYDISQIEPNIAAYYSVDGQLYSMPFNSSTPIMYINRDAFIEAGLDPDNPPKNFDEIMAACEKLVKKDENGNITQYGFGMGNYGWFFEQWVGKMGLDYVDQGNGRDAPATKVVFDENGAALQILSTWDKLIKEGYITYLNRGNDDAKSAFITGNIAMVLESTAALKSLLVNVDDRFEIGTAYFPSINADDAGGVSIGGGSLWAINNGDDAKRAASWEFIKFMISPEQQAYWNAQTGYFPITVATHELDAFKANIEEYPQFMTAIDQLHDTKPEYTGSLLSVFPEARAKVEEITERVIMGELTPEEAVTQLAAQINEAITIYNLTNN